MNTGLPTGWCTASFSDVARIASDLVDPMAWPAAPHIAPDNIERDTGKLLPYRTIQQDAVKSAKHHFRAGQLLYSKIRPYLNKCVLVDFDGLCSADIYPVESFVDRRFLHYYMLTNRFVADVARASGSRTVLPKTNQAQMEHLAVPVAPLGEQARIVEALDSFFTRLDDAVANMERVQRNLQRYRASVLKAAVEGRLVPTEAELARVEGRTYEPAAVVLERILAERRRRWEEAELAKLAANGDAPKDDRWKAKYVQPLVPDVSVLPDLPEGWCWTRIGTAGRVQLGRQRSPAHHTGTHMRPYLRVANVFEDRIDVSDVMTMNFTEKEFETYRLEFGDILLNEGQSPHLVGRPAMYRDELPGACFTNSLVRFQATEGVDRRFALIVFLAQLHTRRYMRIAQITTNIAHLGAGRFAEIEFPLPPQSEQARIADEVERVMSTVEATMATVAFNLARLNRCRQSILGWAFEGRLVDQGPSDEPASALLTRIRAERHARTAEAGRRRRRGSTALRARRRKEQENA